MMQAASINYPGGESMKETTRLVLAKRAAVAYANANGHKMGRFGRWGTSECANCGAILVDTDAETFVTHSSVVDLGSLSAPCPSAD